MAYQEERLKVLKMIQEGKISPEEAAQLLETLDETSPQETTSQPRSGQPSAQGNGRWFRVRVIDTDTGKMRVNVRIPLSMVTAGMKMGMRFAPEVQGLDLNELLEIIKEGQTGQIADVYDDKDGERVEVFVE